MAMKRPSLPQAASAMATTQHNLRYIHHVVWWWTYGAQPAATYTHTACTSFQQQRLADDATSLGIEELGKMVGVETLPPEVEPLADCFQRASARVEEASNVREALEAEVCAAA